MFSDVVENDSINDAAGVVIKIEDVDTHTEADLRAADVKSDVLTQVETDFDASIDSQVRNNQEKTQPSARKDQPLDKVNNRVPSRQPAECPVCQRTFSGIFNVRRHFLLKHPTEKKLLSTLTTGGGRCSKCLMCQQQFSHVKYLKNHLNSEHEMKFDHKEITFKNGQEFLAWKEEVEKRTDSVYIKASGTKLDKQSGEQVQYFRCNRSGNYKGKVKSTQRKRRIKSYETVKLDLYCTSVIKVVTRPREQRMVTAYFCATHYGHDGFKECREKGSEIRRRSEPKLRRYYAKKSKMIGTIETNTCASSTDWTTEMLGTSGDVNEADENDIVENSTSPEDGAIDSTDANEDMGESYLCCEEDNVTVPVGHNTVPNETVSADTLPPLKDIRGPKCCLSVVENGLSPKQRFVNSLKTLINVIDRCQSDEVLNRAAFGVEELTRTFVPLLGMEMPPDVTLGMTNVLS